MVRLDEGGPNYPWGNDQWPGLEPDPGTKDWNKQAIYDDPSLEKALDLLRVAYGTLVDAQGHLPKAEDIQPAHYGPPIGQRLAADGAMAAGHMQNGFTAFTTAWNDFITKVERTKSKHYDTEDSNRGRVQQANDWK